MLALLAGCWIAPASQAAEAENRPDPWEGFNRAIFGFNETLDIYAMEPVARGWDKVVPDPVERSLVSFFENLAMPVVLLNEILQARPREAWEDLARFAVNTTVGVAGLYDAATAIHIPHNENDFGLTFGRWGIPAGPYLVLPFWGPSNVRDTAGLAALYGATPYQYFIPLWASIAARSVQVVNTRAQYLEEIAQERASALDFYVFVRDAYIQNRRFKLEDRKPIQTQESADDLYYFEDEEEVDGDAGGGDDD